MKLSSPRLLYLLPLFLTITLIIFGEALGDLWKDDVQRLFQQNKWLLLAFVGLLALVGYLWERLQRSEKSVHEAVDKTQYDETFAEFRKNLLEQYQIRLSSKTGRRLPVNLAAKSTHFGTASDRVEVYFTDKEMTIQSENIASEIDKILKANDRLLLIGDPGAGKTTILLYAAINILNSKYSSDDLEPSSVRSDDSKSSDRLKLPLILNLGTWGAVQNFAEWYALNIAHTYNISSDFVQELFRRNVVIPFFDGFDEVKEEYRDDCFDKMATFFGDVRNRQFIVSSRKKEYAAAKADAPIFAELEVLPLSVTQIKKALSENAESQAADLALLHAIENDRWLAEAVETPFYLNTASFLFGKGQRTLADFAFNTDSTEGRQKELVEIFVTQQVPGELDRKYLGFLAKKMVQENFLTFELISMQPWWCKSPDTFQIINNLTIGLSFGFISSIIGIIIGGDIGGLLIGIVAGLLFITGTEKGIKTSEVQLWSWKHFKRLWIYFFAFGSLIGSLFSLMFTGIIIFKVGPDIQHLGVDYVLWLADACFLLVFGVIMASNAGLIRGFLFDINTPYQRFRLTFKLGFLIMSIFALLILSILWASYLINFQFINLGVGILFKNASSEQVFIRLIISTFLVPILVSKYPQHFLLRLLLYFENKLPIRLVSFLDRMTDQFIFEDTRRTVNGKKQRGATWRFRHKILQDYFAKMENTK